MATQLFLRDIASDLGGAGQKALSTTRGAASTTAVTNTTASGTNIVVTQTGGGQALAWFSAPLAAQSISGTVDVTIRAIESGSAVNSGAGILIERVNSAGVVQSTILADQTIPTTITEYSNVADSAKTQTALSITATTFAAGDRIKVTLKVRNVGTMGAGSVTNSYDGPTASAAGDTFVTFSQTLSLLTLVSDGDTATATDAVSLSVTLTGAETSGDAESGSVASGTNVNGSDTSTSTEAATLTVAITATDPRSILDVIQLAAAITTPETGTSTEARTLAVTLTGTESSGGTDTMSALSTGGSQTVADVAGVVESFALAVVLPGQTDNSTATDASTLSQLVAKSGADTASVVDAATLAVALTMADLVAAVENIAALTGPMYWSFVSADVKTVSLSEGQGAVAAGATEITVTVTSTDGTTSSGSTYSW